MNNQLNEIQQKTLRELSLGMELVINSLSLAESDKGNSISSASVIRLCINRLLKDASLLNDEFGSDWPENK